MTLRDTDVAHRSLVCILNNTFFHIRREQAFTQRITILSAMILGRRRGILEVQFVLARHSTWLQHGGSRVLCSHVMSEHIRNQIICKIRWMSVIARETKGATNLARVVCIDTVGRDKGAGRGYSDLSYGTCQSECQVREGNRHNCDADCLPGCEERSGMLCKTLRRESHQTVRSCIAPSAMTIFPSTDRNRHIT